MKVKKESKKHFHFHENLLYIANFPIAKKGFPSMGNVFLIGGGMMLVWVNTKKGFEYRWKIILIFAVLFLGTIVYQVKQLDARHFNPVYIGVIK